MHKRLLLSITLSICTGAPLAGCLEFECRPSDLSCNVLALSLYFQQSGPADRRTVVAGANHTCALLATGAIRCWGSGTNGRLGYNATTSVGDGIGPAINSAGDVPLGASAVQISAGNGHTCAVLSTGAVRCWGVGGSGQLGYNNTLNVGDSAGTSILAAGDVPLGGSAKQVAAGFLHTCALLVGGTVRCWGSGANGPLGYNNGASVGDGVGIAITAAGDVPLGGTATQITAGNTVSCALLTTGAVRCWGFGGGGVLGYNNTTTVGAGVTSIVAAGDVPLGGSATSIFTSGSHTCALLTTGAVRCWGAGANGRLGYNAVANVADGIGVSITTAGDIATGGMVTEISVGNQHTCARLSSGAIRCWGDGTDGRLGYNSVNAVGDGIGFSIAGAGDIPLGGTAMRVSAGDLHTCAMLSTGAVRCWGSGASGRLGYNNTNTVGNGVGLAINAAGDVPYQ
jgi:alpha-tubulin suppressor-like RCC1 family protein